MICSKYLVIVMYYVSVTTTSRPAMKSAKRITNIFLST